MSDAGLAMPLERVTRHAALGLRFWDIATGETAVDGLRVTVFPRNNPHRPVEARPGPGGVYAAHRLPGLVDWSFTEAEPPQALWPVATRPFRVEVDDPLGRYLPLAFDADLPARGLFTWLAPWLSPPQAVPVPQSAGSPPPLLAERIPLFSAPARTLPEPLAVVYAQLADLASGQELAWALLAVAIDGVPRGLGLADEHGRVAVMFPYAEPPRPLLASPMPAHDDFAWEIELTAYGAAPSSPPAAVPRRGDLAPVLHSLDAPVVTSLFSPPAPLRLSYRRPLVVRTEGAAGAASLLFVA